MKNVIILIICFLMHSFAHAQILNDIDEIAPFHEGISEIKKVDQWAFINIKGIKVIDFRNDLVSSKIEKNGLGYPLFKNGRWYI